MKRSMRGMTMVEFAIVAAALFMIIFASIEFGRASFTLAALNEGTRRGARLAAVCPLNDPAIAAAVNFASIPGFSSANVTVSYLDASGNPLGASPPLVSVYYVRVAVTGFTLPLTVPFINPTIGNHPYTATLPAESLGISDQGVSTAC